MSIRKSIGIDKYENFPEWYQAVLKEAGVIDIRYPVKGMYVWMPYGLKALRLTQRIIVDLLEKTGHQEAYFPTMVPESVFSREKDFLQGFGGETFIVEGTMTRRFNERLFVRPTSETVMYYMWNMWIKGRKDLPLKMYQVVNVFRYETKMTHPILRVREIMGFIEAHTAHHSREEAEKQIIEAIGIYKEFFNRLQLPYFIVKTPPWDTFAGAEYNYDFITVMPDGKGLELGSVINLGQKFAGAFEIKFMDTDGEEKYVYQTCYGVSERVLGAVIGIHGDEVGLFFPPEIAPIQVVIVPIMKPGEKEILEYALKIGSMLESHGLRVFIDSDLEHTPGWKYYYWEMKGVPTRIEVGAREVETSTVTIARRDKREKQVVRLEEVLETLRKIWSEINEYLRIKGLEHLKKKTIFLPDYLENKGFNGLIIAPWDGSKGCAEELEKETGKNVLGEIVESPIPLPSPTQYMACSNKADRYALLGVTY
ncbi:prolyl-tRNA synthetase [Desulfurococcus amylolyticus 1221n]|uniref:Proline--tRNA ligase n=1 Tax=Desulfurococcus amylolyticus (strain DSM 18924 / JCM 16383 / VKM B-2413 / 1221n) TaxID=490899 RepID=B8D5E6_DESA1|nr:proline--tRNA ligase [Desulfurococcus amylolyticus]ACL11327.1 prolyl-tRNA synthetase [Desulfurococcus amylolyticus 1221n]